MPKLSIIVPVYNAEAWLADTIKAILEQTFRDFEVILVDDGSTDLSAALCDAFAKEDQRIRVCHKENGGVASARNAGLSYAVGDYIGWVDSDDYISPVMYQIMMEQAEKHNADIVQCEHSRELENIQMIYPEETIAVDVLNGLDSLKRIYQKRHRYTNSMSLWSKVYRKGIFDGVRFTEGCAFEDDERVPYLLYRGSTNVFCDLPLYQYIRRECSIVTAPNVKNIQALTMHLENRMLWFEELDEWLYLQGKKHFYHYLCRKVCEKEFRETVVQNTAVYLLKKYRKAFWSIAHPYDHITIMLLYGGERMVGWIAENDFAPIQNQLAKIKRVLGI